VFGTPSTMLERDSQWTLRPDSDARAPALFLLVNGSYEKPAVWLFDPYDGGDNVWKTAVEAQSDVDKIIKVVQGRVAAAAASWLNDGRPPARDGQLDGQLDGHRDGHRDGRPPALDGHRDGHRHRQLDGRRDGHMRHSDGIDQPTP
jgi:hypothetical protein